MGKSRQGYTLGPDAIRELTEMRDWFRSWRKSDGIRPSEPFTKFGPRVFRWAKCQTNTLCTSYPSRPANNFPIVFGELDVDTDSCGYQARTFEAYDPPIHRIAHDPYDIYRSEGDIVAVFLAHDKWYILGGSQDFFAEGVLSEDLCALPDDDEDEQNVTSKVTGTNYLPTCESFTPNKIINDHRHEGRAGDKVLMIRKECQSAAGEEKWLIFDIEQRAVCVYVGIEDRPSCLVAAALRIRTEWCPAGEPTVACNIVDYTDCSTTLTTCDDSWSFDPLWACCWLPESGGGGDSGSPTSPRTPPSSIYDAPGAVPGRFKKDPE